MGYNWQVDSEFHSMGVAGSHGNYDDRWQEGMPEPLHDVLFASVTPSETLKLYS